MKIKEFGPQGLARPWSPPLGYTNAKVCGTICFLVEYQQPVCRQSKLYSVQGGKGTLVLITLRSNLNKFHYV